MNPGLVIAIALPVALFGALWGGWVLSTLWGWFVVPLGVPAIGVAHAVGLVATAKWLSAGSDDNTELDEDFLIGAVATGIGGPSVAFLVGLVAQWWM